MESDTVVAAVSVVVSVAETQVWLSTVVVTGGLVPSVVEAILIVQVLLIVFSVSVDDLCFHRRCGHHENYINKIQRSDLELDQIITTFMGQMFWFRTAACTITRNYGTIGNYRKMRFGS